MVSLLLSLPAGERGFIWPPRRKGRTMRSISLEATLFNPDPSSYLPHRAPFLYLDRITAWSRAAPPPALLQLRRVPGFPPILLLEAMAQLGGIVAGQQEGEGGIRGDRAGRTTSGGRGG